MKQALRVVFSALVLGLAGCLPVSQNPLSSPDTAMADSRLAGVWYGKSGEDTIFLHFVAGKGAQMDVAEVDHQKSGEAHTSIYTMFPSKLDGIRYMNIREKMGVSKNYYLARYVLSSSGTLSIWLMSEKAVSKAINDEKISGKISVKEHGDRATERDVTITSSTAHLAAFVKKTDPDILFSEKFGTFKKLALPSFDSGEKTKAAAKSTKTDTPAKSKTSSKPKSSASGKTSASKKKKSGN